LKNKLKFWLIALCAIVVLVGVGFSANNSLDTLNSNDGLFKFYDNSFDGKTSDQSSNDQNQSSNEADTGSSLGNNEQLTEEKISQIIDFQLANNILTKNELIRRTGELKSKYQCTNCRRGTYRFVSKEIYDGPYTSRNGTFTHYWYSYKCDFCGMTTGWVVTEYE